MRKITFLLAFMFVTFSSIGNELSESRFAYVPTNSFMGTDTTPTANDDTANATQGGSKVIIDVLLNDDYGTNGANATHPLTLVNGKISTASANGATIEVVNGKVEYTPTQSFSGTDTFNYTITDLDGDADTGTVTITVSAVTAGYAPDTATVAQDSSDNIIDVMANDTDDAGFGPSDTRFLIESVDHLTGSTEKGGTVELETYNTADTADDVILYTPRAGFSGTDTFNYVPGNNRNTLVQVTVTVTATPNTNTTPTANDDTASAAQGGSAVDINVTANDNYGTDGASTTTPLTFSNGSTSNASANGASIEVVTGQIRYTPTATFSGTDTFTYVITDADGEADSATVTVNVSSSGATSFVPDAFDDSTTVSINSGATVIDVLANDSAGADGYINGGLTMVNGTLSSASAEGGAISIDNKGTGDVSDDEFSYTPPAGFSGTDTFQYTITDTTGDADTATVTVTVNDVATPTANDDSASVVENSSNNSIAVLTNDSAGSDGYNSPAVTISSGTTANGTIATDGTVITYTPTSSFTGTDSFTYTVTDATGDTDTATVNVTVTATPAANSTPTANDDTATATQGGGAVDINVTANDSYGSDGPSATSPLTFSNGSTSNASTNGASIEVVTGQIRYTPTASFSGTDSFTYVITDEDGEADSATVTVTVTGSGATFIPDAVDDTATVSINSGATVIDVLANDSAGADGYIDGGLTMTNGTLTSASAEGGAISIDNKGTGDVSDDEFSYTPPAGFSGTDTFSYTITDASGDADTATVTVTVVDSATPTAVDDAFTVVENSGANAINVLTNDLAGANPPITVLSYDALGANGGTVVLNPDGSGTYTPPASFTGTDTFEYIISSSGGSDTGSVTITITSAAAVNSTPTANNDTASATQGGASVDIDVTDNDDYGTDGANATHPLTFSNGSLSNASTNGASIEVVNGEIRYTPTTSFSGTDTFTYVITDEDGEADSATVTVTVASSGGGGGGGGAVTNPDAVNDSATVNENSSSNSIDVLDNDDIGSAGFIAGHGLRLQGGLSQRFTNNGGFLEVNDNGTANDASDDTIEYTPVNGFSGTETFTYTITNANGIASTATVTVTVNGVPKVKTSGAYDFNNSFTVYPNPSKGFVNTKITSNTSAQANLYVIDVTGKVVFSKALNLIQGTNNISFNLPRATGVLFVKVVSNTENYGTQKVIFE